MNLNELYKSPSFQKALDMCRVLTVVLLIVILFYLFINIESVILLNQDVCAICMKETKSICVGLK